MKQQSNPYLPPPCRSTSPSPLRSLRSDRNRRKGDLSFIDVARPWEGCVRVWWPIPCMALVSRSVRPAGACGEQSRLKTVCLHVRGEAAREHRWSLVRIRWLYLWGWLQRPQFCIQSTFVCCKICDCRRLCWHYWCARSNRSHTIPELFEQRRGPIGYQNRWCLVADARS